MIINTITLNNFRCFESFTTTFQEDLTVIVGNNGAGKSSLLDGVSIAAGTFLAGLDGVYSIGISKHDAMNKCYDMGSVIDLQPQFPVSISAHGIINGKAVSWMRELNTSAGRATSRSANEIISIAKEYQSRIRAGDQEIVLPLLSYYGTGRLWAQKKEKSRSRNIAKFSRTVGYTDCLAAESNEKQMMDWFEKMTIQEVQKGHISPEFAAVKQAVSQCYQSITNSSDVQILFNFDTHGIDIQYSDSEGTHGCSPLSNLSDGYKNTLSMIADIAYRMAVLNPQLLERVLTDTPGIVLIDEVDLHLHPLWQQRILRDLRSIFPSIQFIVSTHAPSVISSVRKENLLILAGDGENYQPNVETYGSDTNSILTSIMAADERPAEIKAQFATFYAAIDAGELDKGEHILTELAQVIGTSDPELTSARITLDLEKI